MNVFVCMYVNVYVYMYVHVHEHVHEHVHAHVHVHMHMYVHVNVHVHVCVCVYVRLRVHVYVHVYVRVRVHGHVHRRVRQCARTLLHVRACASVHRHAFMWWVGGRLRVYACMCTGMYVQAVRASRCVCARGRIDVCARACRYTRAHAHACGGIPLVAEGEGDHCR